VQRVSDGKLNKAGSAAGQKRPRKTGWDDGGQPLSAKAKRFDQFYCERIKHAAGSVEPHLLKLRNRKDRIKNPKMVVDVDLDAIQLDNEGSKKIRYDCITFDKAT